MTHRCLAPLIALGFATLPAVSMASCVPGAKPSYQDVTAVYFRSEGVTEPVAIGRGDPVQPGACPVTVVLYVSPSDADMGGGPACFTDRSGKMQRCCGATDSRTEDSPRRVFDRLVAVLEKDRFYGLTESTPLTRSNGAAFYSIAVMRCGAQARGKGVSIAFVGPPQPRPNTSIVALNIPFGSAPEAFYDSNVIVFFDDFTRAIYQSRWSLEDIW